MANSASYVFIGDKECRKNPIYRDIRTALDLNSEFNEIISSGPKDAFVDRRVLVESTQIAQEHPFCRIDLVKGLDGKFWVAEIEVDKIHGFGYATLCRELSKHPIGVGLINRLVEISQSNVTGIVLFDHERFYIPELNFFVDRVNRAGGHLVSLNYDDFEISTEGLFKLNLLGLRLVALEQLVSIPMFKSKDLDKVREKRILEQHTLGNVRVLSMPFRALGEKTTLAMLHNISGNLGLEALLDTCFGNEAKEVLRSFIPQTEFLGIANRDRKLQVAELIRSNPFAFFVKVKDESGARGIAEPGNLKRQLELVLGQDSKRVIVQRAIQPEIIKLAFCDLLSGEIGEGEFTVRYSLFVSGNGEILDMSLTASPGIVAHGGTESIQLGTKLEL